MKEEIKEILDYLKIENGTIGSELSYEETHLLLDYITNLQTIEQQYSAILSENAELENKITNLQEENERLKELCDKYEEEHSTVFNLWKMKMEEMPTYEEKEDYKSRIDKAVEYIEEHTNWFERNTIYETSEFDILISPKVLLNILGGKNE